MAVESADDRATMLEDWDTATVDGSSVSGIFTNGYFGAESNGVEVAGSRPEFLCRSSDVSSITLGTSTAIIDGTTYTIVASEPDGVGMILLVLQEQ